MINCSYFFFERPFNIFLKQYNFIGKHIGFAETQRCGTWFAFCRPRPHWSSTKKSPCPLGSETWVSRCEKHVTACYGSFQFLGIRVYIFKESNASSFNLNDPNWSTKEKPIVLPLLESSFQFSVLALAQPLSSYPAARRRSRRLNTTQNAFDLRMC